MLTDHILQFFSLPGIERIAFFCRLEIIGNVHRAGRTLLTSVALRALDSLYSLRAGRSGISLVTLWPLGSGRTWVSFRPC